MSQIKSCISCIRYTAVIFVNDMDTIIKGGIFIADRTRIIGASIVNKKKFIISKILI